MLHAEQGLPDTSRLVTVGVEIGAPNNERGLPSKSAQGWCVQDQLGTKTMQTFTLVKVFDLAVAPAELQHAEEAQFLRKRGPDDDEPMLKLWVGQRTTRTEPPTGAPEDLTVTAWEHYLHGWLSQSGALPGDTVFLTWSGAMASSLTQRSQTVETTN